LIALVAVAAAVYAIDKPYSYSVPSGMQLQPGMRIIVPFGRGNRRSEAFVLSVEDRPSDGLKPVDQIMDEFPVLSDDFIRMAAFLRERYFCTFYDAMKAMLPAGLWFETAEIISLSDETKAGSEDHLDRNIVSHLMECGGSACLSDLKKLFCDDPDFEQRIRKLIRKKVLRSNLDYSRKVHDRTEQIATLAVSAEEAMVYAQKKQKSAPVQADVLKLLCAIGSGSVKEISYLTGATSATIRRLESLGYINLSVRDVFRSALPNYVEPADPLVLSEEQHQAYLKLSAQNRCEKPGIALLHGVTGSGKTAVYIKLIRDSLDHGKSAVFLVPEIALTPQLIHLLMSHFGNEVAVLHSALRVSERYDEWKRIRQGKARVVIGTRSAVFAPVHNLGLIIVDEEQEHTYKSENSPRYHAREVAVYRGVKEKAMVILGSATPSIETMHLARSGVYSYVALHGRYNRKPLPPVEIVDLKQEIRKGNLSSISEPLRMALEDNLRLKKQSILFLNRRGAGHCMICVECGEVPQCPRCSVSLTYHKVNQRLMCHYCGYSQPAVLRCSHCGGALKPLGTGTQKLEQELHDLFGDIEILRMDADTISASNSHEFILEKFRKEQIPILIGTQMVTKGLNFDQVTLVGVIDADMSLYVNHFRASETTFSMLTQVIGRSGRGENPGRAVIQTLTPEHSVIQLAAKQDYETFFEQELTIRRLHRFPPFGDLFTVMFMGVFEQDTLSAAVTFRQKLELAAQQNGMDPSGFQILGPSPAAVAKINNSYRFRLTLQCENTRLVRLLLSQLLKDFTKDKKNKGISAFADLNSYE